MKRWILIVMIFLAMMTLGFFISKSFAGEIILDNPLVITQPAIRLVDFPVEFYSDKIAVKFSYYDAESNIVKEKWVAIDGDDYTVLMNARIQAVHVGQKFSDIMFRAIRNKCKNILAVEGTVN